MNMILNVFSTLETLDVVLLILLAVVGVLLIGAMIFALVTKGIVYYTYRKYNKIKTQKTTPANELTQENLESLGLNHVKVKKVGFLRAILGLNMQGYGNSYGSYSKAIFLRKNIINKATITSYAVSTQKVAHAKFDNEKKYKFYYKAKPFMLFAPVLFVPLTLLGVLIDVALQNQIGLFTIVASLISLAIFVAAFILLLITIPIEKKANAVSEQLLLNNKHVTEQELAMVKKVNKSYILSYVADFIYALLQIVWDILKLLIKASQVAKNKK